MCGVRGTLHGHQVARATTNQRTPPAPVPQYPTPYQSRGTMPLFFRARSTTEGGASIGATPKLKFSFRVVKTGGIWLVLCGAEKWSATGLGTGWSPSRGGWGNWRIWDSGTGVGQHLRPQVNLSLLQAPPEMGRHWWWAGDREPLLGQGLVLGARVEYCSKNIPRQALPLPQAHLTCAGWAPCR